MTCFYLISAIPHDTLLPSTPQKHQTPPIDPPKTPQPLPQPQPQPNKTRKEIPHENRNQLQQQDSPRFHVRR